MSKDKVNGRLFGKINIIDALVVLIIIVALFSAGVRYVSIKNNTQSEDASASEAKFSYVVSVKGIRKSTLNGTKKSVGLNVTDTGKKNHYGKIKKVEYENATVYVTDKLGQIKKTSLEDKYDMLITITVDNGTQTEKGYFTKGNRQIYVGDVLYMSVGNIQTSGEIVDIIIK